MSNKKLGVAIGVIAAGAILSSCTNKSKENTEQPVQSAAATPDVKATVATVKASPLTAKLPEQTEIKTEAVQKTPAMPAWIRERNVSNHAGYDGNPSVSNEGWVAFESETGKGKLEIMIVDPSGNKVQASMGGMNKSPIIAGDRVIFSSSAKGKSDVYSFSLKEGQLRNLSGSKGHNVQPTLSGDGKQLAFISTRNGSMQLLSGNQKAIKGLKLNFSAMNPSIANDGAVAFEDSDREIYVVDGKGVLHNVSNHSEVDYNPCISANGRRVVFGSLRNNRRSICIYDRELNKLNVIAEGFNPQLSGAGDIVVYERAAEDGKAEVHALFLNDKLEVVKSVNVSYSRASDYSPAISADGKQVVFVSDRDKNPEVYRVNLEELLK